MFKELLNCTVPMSSPTAGRVSGKRVGSVSPAPPYSTPSLGLPKILTVGQFPDAVCRSKLVVGELESVQNWEAACEWAAEQQRGAGFIACA